MRWVLHVSCDPIAVTWSVLEVRALLTWHPFACGVLVRVPAHWQTPPGGTGSRGTCTLRIHASSFYVLQRVSNG